jgi:nitrite reductase (NAD(P)H)
VRRVHASGLSHHAVLLLIYLIWLQATNIFNAEMKKAGHVLDNNLCPHFSMSRADLFNIIKVKKLRTLAQVMSAVGVDKEAIGCEICKPAVGSILSSL